MCSEKKKAQSKHGISKKSIGSIADNPINPLLEPTDNYLISNHLDWLVVVGIKPGMHPRVREKMIRAISTARLLLLHGYAINPDLL